MSDSMSKAFKGITLADEASQILGGSRMDLIALFNNPNYANDIDTLMQSFIEGNGGVVTEEIQKILDGLNALKQLITDVKTGKANLK